MPVYMICREQGVTVLGRGEGHQRPALDFGDTLLKVVREWESIVISADVCGKVEVDCSGWVGACGRLDSSGYEDDFVHIGAKEGTLDE